MDAKNSTSPRPERLGAGLIGASWLAHAAVFAALWAIMDGAYGVEGASLPEEVVGPATQAVLLFGGLLCGGLAAWGCARIVRRSGLLAAVVGVTAASPAIFTATIWLYGWLLISGRA